MQRGVLACIFKSLGQENPRELGNCVRLHDSRRDGQACPPPPFEDEEYSIGEGNKNILRALQQPAHRHFSRQNQLLAGVSDGRWVLIAVPPARHTAPWKPEKPPLSTPLAAMFNTSSRICGPPVVRVVGQLSDSRSCFPEGLRRQPPKPHSCRLK